MPDHQPGHPDNVGLPLPEPPDSSLPPHLGPSHMISKHTSPAFAYMFGYIVAVVQAVKMVAAAGGGAGAEEPWTVDGWEAVRTRL